MSIWLACASMTNPSRQSNFFSESISCFLPLISGKVYHWLKSPFYFYKLKQLHRSKALVFYHWAFFYISLEAHREQWLEEKNQWLSAKDVNCGVFLCHDLLSGNAKIFWYVKNNMYMNNRHTEKQKPNMKGKKAWNKSQIWREKRHWGSSKWWLIYP